MTHRVAITGVGCVSPLGLTVEENWHRLKQGERGLSHVGFKGFEAFPHSLCGGIHDFQPAASVSNKKLLKLMNRESQFAFIAAQQAIAGSGIAGACAPERIGAFLGTGLTTGDLDSLVPIVEQSIDPEGRFSYALLGTQALAKCNPLLSFKILPNMALSYISIEHTIRGPNMAFNPWPGNTAQAILEAMRTIQSGDVDCAVAGGCDSKCNAISFLTLARLGLLSRSGKSVPLASDADGMIPGEGAACLVLESFEHAARRNAPILAELRGGASSTDCASTDLYPENSACLEETMQDALADACIDRTEIGLISSSLNGHPVGDATEMHAIERVFSGENFTLAALSERTGDMIAAGPAYALAMCAYAFGQNASLPPFLQSPGAHEKPAALINAFALGTTKATIAIRHGSQ
jgi:3-oxoacyl-[acyl-carrier-protein] synthase II